MVTVLEWLSYPCALDERAKAAAEEDDVGVCAVGLDGRFRWSSRIGMVGFPGVVSRRHDKVCDRRLREG